MPNLHAYYHLGNVKAFRQELDGTVPSSSNTSGAGGGGGGGPKVNSGGASVGSAGRSWSLGLAMCKADPNERDALGRTVLHLAASNPSQTVYSFFLILLKNLHVNVNLQDFESGYTALHRALFAGNLRAARDLLARNDTDPSIKDAEGLTAFDLYNGTVDGTNPKRGDQGTDLLVWGANRNLALGTGDSGDKAYPDRANLLTQTQAAGKDDPAERFHHVGVRSVVMSKLHTGVVTTEPRGNLSVCGFGSNGRLGRSVHSQLALLPMPDLPHTIVSIALGQDHTLALTLGGYILSWGHNRFSQLGYTIDPPDVVPPGKSKDDYDVQVSPRRIVGPLRREWVKGVAAGRMSSACWTADSVWTWGTNAGHLGYEKAANPVQVQPRKVTALSQSVIDVALSDYAMVCLLDTFEVVCFHHDTNFRISFSTPRILSDAFPFRPAQAAIKPMIEKVTSCGSTFAALSSIGDVFTFTLPNPLEDISKDSRERHVTVKPQLIWALRKSFTAVKDVALGLDGTVIICTHSGHVFVRQRVKSGAGGLKFKRIPYLQRVINVACNESGAFAAIRVDAKAMRIPLSGKTLEEDMTLLQPHFRRFEHQMTAEDFSREAAGVKSEEDEDEDEAVNSITRDLAVATRLCTILKRWRTDDHDSLFSWSAPLLGSDVHLVVGQVAIPAHRTILGLRVPILNKIVMGNAKVEGIELDRSDGGVRLVFDVSHPMVVLLLLQYLYTDEIAAIWDSRVARGLQAKFSDLALPIGDVKADLKTLAERLSLPPLSSILELASKTSGHTHTLPKDMARFFDSTRTGASKTSDLTVVLADRQVHLSSIILRARCPFFEAMFADQEWTVSRAKEGTVVVDMSHLKWRPMRMVFRYIHEGLEDDLFDYLHQETLDEFLDFVFEVLAAATELLLDRLVLICSRVIAKHCNAYNAAALACEASFYQATTLKLSIFDYIISCMETMLESGLLDEMHEDVLLDLSRVISSKQGKKLSVSRSGMLVNAAMERQKQWIALQDIPGPRVRQLVKWRPRSPALSPVDAAPLTARVVGRSTSALASPELGATANSVPSSFAGGDEMFTMDDDMSTPMSSATAPTPRTSRPMTPLDLGASSATVTLGKSAVWKSKTVEIEKVDLRSVMAETAASKPGRVVPGSFTGKTPPGGRRLSPAPTGTTPTKPSILARSPPATTLGHSSGPWRQVDKGKTSFASLQSHQQAATPRRPVGSQAWPLTPNGGAKVFTPVRPAPGTATPRKISSSGSAWSSPAVGFAPAPPVVSSVSPDTRAFSLLDIQQQEKAYADRAKKPAPRSFMEIQAEERAAEAARAQEVEFMRWWEEEQSRVASGNGTVHPQTSGGGGRGKARGRGRGGGGGGGGGGRGQRKVPPPSRGKGRGGGQSGRGLAQETPGRSATPATAPTAAGRA